MHDAAARGRWSLGILSLICLLGAPGIFADMTKYNEMCDASAAIALDDSHFIVANDEDNLLRIYRVDQSHPVRTYDLSRFLGIAYDDKSPESDIEGAARIGEFLFFISSHGRDKKGRRRENRYQFFAVKIGRDLNMEPVGHAYHNLMDGLVRVKALQKTALYDSYLPHKKKVEKLAPKKNGVNVEGLATIPGTDKLIIGFRNPVPTGKAILVVLQNPVQVVLQGERPKFGDVVFLPLGNRGVRDIAFHAGLKKYLIIGGSFDSKNRSQLFIWSGSSQDNPQELAVVDFEKQNSFNPEEIVVYDNLATVQILSDDGTMSVFDGAGSSCNCKALDDANRKFFRSLWLDESDLSEKSTTTR